MGLGLFVTCEPDGASTEAPTEAHDLTSLASGHMLGLVGNVSGLLALQITRHTKHSSHALKASQDGRGAVVDEGVMDGGCCGMWIGRGALCVEGLEFVEGFGEKRLVCY